MVIRANVKLLPVKRQKKSAKKLKKEDFKVSSIKKGERTKKPPLPFLQRLRCSRSVQNT